MELFCSQATKLVQAATHSLKSLAVCIRSAEGEDFCSGDWEKLEEALVGNYNLTNFEVTLMMGYWAHMEREKFQWAMRKRIDDLMRRNKCQQVQNRFKSVKLAASEFGTGSKRKARPVGEESEENEAKHPKKI